MMKSKFGSLFVASACYFIALMLFYAQQNLEKIIQQWGNQNSVLALLDSEVTDKELFQLQKEIRNYPEVQNTQLLSRSQIAEQVHKTLSQVDGNLYSAAEVAEFSVPALLITMSQIKDINKFAEELKKHWQISEVITGGRAQAQAQSIQQTTRTASMVLIIILTAACLMVVQNSIQTEIFSRREEIEILELVGASPRRVRWPFVKQALLLNGAGIATALIVLGFAHISLRTSLGHQERWAQISLALQFLTVTEIGLFVLVFIVLSVVTTYSSVARLNSGWLAARRTSS